MYTFNDFLEEFCFLLGGIILGLCWAAPPPPPGIPWWVMMGFAIPPLGLGVLTHFFGEWEKERLREKRSLDG